VRKMGGSLLPLLFAMVCIAAPAALAAAGEGGTLLNEALFDLDNSSLPQEAKLEVRVQADRAVKKGVPADDVAVIVDRSLKRGAEGGQIAGFLKTAAAVREQHLPVRPVLDRVEEGLSKGVPVGRISTVVRGLAEKLASARPIVSSLAQGGLKPGSGQDEAIETVARALEKSIPRSVILDAGSKVMEQEGSLELFNRAVDTMTFLVGSGMPVKKASRLVASALDQSYPEREMQKIGATAVAGLQKGGNRNNTIVDRETRRERESMHDNRERMDRDQRMDRDERMDRELMRGPGAGPGRGGPKR
jgi:hypothetical protein